jgi:hypothetical protein
MNVEEQRRLGVRLATEANAPKTLAAIKDADSCYETILKTAAEEVGVEKLVAAIKDQDPSWSHYALEYIPELGEHGEELSANAAAFAETSGAVQGTAGGFELYLITGAVFECYFTMFWQNEPDGPIYPAAVESDQDKWVWSGKLSISINRSYSYDCKHFEIPNAGILPGAKVWMYVKIVAGTQSELTQYTYKYDPNAATIRIDTWGTTFNPKYGIHQS